MIEVSWKSKDFFFDKKHVEDRIGKAAAKAISRGLAHVRGTAANSMRKRKRASKPGQAPSRHFGSRFEGLGRILFFYDPNLQSGIVGPVRHRTKITSSNNTLPQLLEHGGRANVQVFAYDSKNRRISRWGNVLTSTRSGKQRRRKAKVHHYRSSRRAPSHRVTIKPRPFMSAALQVSIEKGKIVKAFEGTVTNV